MKLKSMVAVLLLMTIGVLEAQNVKKLAREVFENSGMKQQVELIDAQMATVVSQNPVFANEPKALPFKNAMLQVMSAKNIEKLLIKYFEEEVPLDDLVSMSDLLKKPLVKEFSLKERAVMDPSKQTEMNAYKEQLLTNPPSAKRLELIDTLLDDINAVEMARDLSLTIVKAIMKGGNSMQPADKQLTDEQVESRISSIFPANMEVTIRKAVQENSLYAYKDVSDEKLSEYVAVWSSDGGKVTMSHMIYAMSSVFEQLGEQIGKAFGLIKN